MTDDTLKDLVLKHDNEISLLASSIQSQSKSIENLAESNTETNKRLEEISKYLAKQVVFDNKLETMDRELTESFRRVHARINELHATQDSNTGCKSVQLLNKDVQSLAKDTTRLVNSLNNVEQEMRTNNEKLDNFPSPKLLQWVIGGVIVYLISFGSYVITSLQDHQVYITKILERIDK